MRVVGPAAFAVVEAEKKEETRKNDIVVEETAGGRRMGTSRGELPWDLRDMMEAA